MHIIWTIIIGFIAGVIAKFVAPGDNEPSGFVLTTILGIVGAFLATYLGQAIGWYRADEGAGLIGAVVGAVIILVIWGFIAGRMRSSPYRNQCPRGDFVLISPRGLDNRPRLFLRRCCGVFCRQVWSVASVVGPVDGSA